MRTLQLAVVFCWAALASAACLPVSGERITARDLAAADGAFSALPETLVFGYAPLPGAVRTITRLELASIARSHAITASVAGDVCFTVPLDAGLDEKAVLAAMRRALPANAAVQLIETLKSPVPKGELLFPVEGIEPAPPADPFTQTWKGFVRYSGTRRLPVWARVRITLDREVLIAKRALRQGEVVDADAVSAETEHGALRPEQVAGTLPEALGRRLLRPIKQGDTLPLRFLERPPDIHRGDSVKVEVVNGSAHLSFDAVAETNARQGEFVQLRNPVSGKTFRAQLKTAGLAVLSMGSPLGGKLQ